ncbi:MAG: EAL domain-containing protein [Armatimonadota bacterium]|nr:EAL domain-containing protein [Armatimonadota bacterium]
MKQKATKASGGLKRSGTSPITAIHGSFALNAAAGYPKAVEPFHTSEASYRSLFEANPYPMWVYDLETLAFLAVNDATIMHYGYSKDEFLQMSIRDIRPPEELENLMDDLEDLPPLRQKSGPWLHQKRDGARFYVELNSHELQFGDRDARVVLASDITERIETEKALRQAEEKYRNIFENAVEGIFQTTPGGRYLSVNPALARIYGYPSLDDLVAEVTDISQQLYVDSNRRNEFKRLLRARDQVLGFEAQIRRRDGTIVWISENARAVRDENGAILYYEGTVEDITQQKAAEQQLVHNAFHDKLTALANRALIMDRLTHLIDRTRRRRGYIFAVLFLDCDRFKVINDRLGHAAGDRLLVAVSQRLLNCVRVCDTVARLGGDEFAILLEEVRSEDEAILAADRIKKEVARPFDLDGESIFTSVSIGIAISSKSHLSADSLVREADIAMYQAKSHGGARHEVFVPEMEVGVRARFELETDMRWAVERGEFQLHYQPIVSLSTGRIAGFEALSRWLHPGRGWVPPSEFIPLAEETGFILSIGRWVLMEACRQAQQWREQFPHLQPIPISVNLSGRQFSQPKLIEEIRQALAETGLDPICLKVEITESSLMENNEAAAEMLQQAQDLGIRKSLDDFGTGYSSLSYLHRLPIDTLKIDRSFVSPIGSPGENVEIVRTIITLAHNLGKDVVAEGIETEQQCTALRAMGCEYGQGFYFSPAVDGPSAAALIREGREW